MNFDMMDESLLGDFLTESGELIEQLDQDLLRLEEEGPSQDLLDSVFRALHTIKGAASFLHLTEIIEFAHAAEDALNCLRKGEAEVNEHVTDCMLQSVDVVRSQMDELGSGAAVTPGPADLIEALQAIANGGAAGGASNGEDNTEASSDEGSDSGASACPFGGESVALDVTEEKLDVLPFMIEDLRASVGSVKEPLESLLGGNGTPNILGGVGDLCDAMDATASYFSLADLQELIEFVRTGCEGLGGTAEEAWGYACGRILAAARLIEEIASGLEEHEIRSWDWSALKSSLEALLGGGDLGEIAGEASSDAEAVLRAEGVWTDDAPATAPDQPPAEPAQSSNEQTDQQENPNGSGPASDAAAQGADAKQTTSKVAQVEQTIRVEVGRLESLLNLVGEMTLTKNQILGIARTVRDENVTAEFAETFSTMAGDLDRLTSELQVGVMRTRMQPLEKVFGRYPRIVRDLAKKTEKKVNLEIHGGDTEVDKSVLELLGDPLIHMIRNSCDHGLENPEDRKAAGKDEIGTIVLAAEHQGGHVRILIEDDGRGIDRDVIGGKAVEKGLTTADQLASMADEDVFGFIFAAGFSTAAEVSDLSGRGVGMDVVRTNISEMNGTISVRSKKGEGTQIEVLIPLTVAIMPAMVVGIGDHDYAIPLSAIEEIVKYLPEETDSVAGSPVMRLRERVLPLIDLRERLGETREGDQSGFSVVVSVGQDRAGLIVDRLIGQQEVVIKPLDDEYTTGGPFSGATIREDGDVSLILDVVKVLRATDNAELCAPGAEGTN